MLSFRGAKVPLCTYIKFKASLNLFPGYSHGGNNRFAPLKKNSCICLSKNSLFDMS